ncbi:uncharacterized protein [Triticum aestivum]|uniref:uncharacterized protein n=1 Tax=Triticum aestivum TaxID=4565 RepID=UPI001D01BCE1|nr:uncharacterized protein LOC123081789 [Triticum aestivum]
MQNLLRGGHGYVGPEGGQYRSGSSSQASWISRKIKNDLIGEHNDVVTVDGCIVRSNFTLDKVALALEKWGEEQKQVVHAIGLGGILKLGKTGKNFISFTLSLLERIDPSDSSMRLSGGVKSILGEIEICSYMDLRKGGLSLQRQVGRPSGQQCVRARLLLGMEPMEAELTVGDLVKKLQEPVDSTMSARQRLKTELGSAMLAVAAVFGPGDGRNHVPTDAYQLVDDLSKIYHWNYGRYALEEIIRGAMSLAEAKMNGYKSICLYGCPTILQIHYFSSVDTGFLTLDTSQLAHVNLYSSSVVRAFIEADTLVEAGDMKFGVLKVKVSQSAIPSGGGCIHSEALLYIKDLFRTSKEKADSTSDEFTQVISKVDSNDVDKIRSLIEQHEMAQCIYRLKDWKTMDGVIGKALQGKCAGMPKLKTQLLEGVVLDSENPKVVNEYNQGGASVIGSVCVHEDHDVKTVAEVLAGMKTGLLGPDWSGASARRQGTGEITVAVHSTEHSVLPHDESSVIENSGMHVVSTRTNIIGGTHAGRYETAQPVLKFYARRPVKRREFFLVGERTNEGCTVVSETVKIDETYNVLALEAVKVKSLDVGLPAASVTAGEQLHPSGGIMLDDDPHSVKQKSISQINRLIEVCKCQKVAGKSVVAGSVAYIVRTNDVLKSCNDALRKSKGMELKRCWIDHPFPNELKISGAEIKAMMKPGAEVNTRQFEIFRRLVYSEDKKLYAPGSLLRLGEFFISALRGKCWLVNLSRMMLI